VAGPVDDVFKALADPTRRHLLDRLHERNGLTLSELCTDLAMARQSATQHLSILEAANLVTAVRRGRERLHYLNPVPIHEIQQRWIHKFDAPRLRALSAIKRAAEEQPMSTAPTFVYVTYIEASPERVWHALTDADLSGEYWAHRNESDWQVGSEWRHVRPDGSGIADVVGEVLESDPPRRLVITFGGSTKAIFTIDQHGAIVRLTLTHEDLPSIDDYEAAAAGWPAVLANLKSLLETGHALPQAPWEMHADGPTSRR
jgi:uncharacterized protein YndB with AHSA1/START domain/DNA-binding transcriptional ArsR family regulator